jgi:hypothetical protein
MSAVDRALSAKKLIAASRWATAEWRPPSRAPAGERKFQQTEQPKHNKRPNSKMVTMIGSQRNGWIYRCTIARTRFRLARLRSNHSWPRADRRPGLRVDPHHNIPHQHPRGRREKIQPIRRPIINTARRVSGIRCQLDSWLSGSANGVACSGTSTLPMIVIAWLDPVIHTSPGCGMSGDRDLVARIGRWRRGVDGIGGRPRS